MKNIDELLLLEGIDLSSLSDRVLRKLQTLRLGKSESFNFTKDNVLEMSVQYTLPTAENVLDNILTASRLFTNQGNRLIDLIISKDGDYRFYPNIFFYYTDSELNNNIATLELIRTRNENMKIRFEKAYNVDFTNHKNNNLILNTDNQSPKEITQMILKNII